MYPQVFAFSLRRKHLNCLLMIACSFLLIVCFSPVFAQEQSEPEAEQVVYLPAVMLDAQVGSTEDEIEFAEEYIDVSEPEWTDVSAAAISPIYTVTSTEDYKGLGYTDCRKIARDKANNLYVAYRRKSSVNVVVNGVTTTVTQYHIFVAKSSDGGKSWDDVNNRKPVENVNPKVDQRVPCIMIDESTGDGIHVVWYGSDRTEQPDKREIWYTRSTNGGASWELVKRLSEASAASYSCPINKECLWQEHPIIYIDGSQIYVAWEDSSIRDAKGKPMSRIAIKRSGDLGKSWSNAIYKDGTLTNYNGKAILSRPTLIVTKNSAGSQQLLLFAYGAFTDTTLAYANTAQLYWSMSTTKGQSWTAWENVARNPAEDQRDVSIARDKTGRIHLVWRQRTLNKNSILRYRIFDPSLNIGKGNWVTSALTIVNKPQVCVFFPSITITSTDTIAVAWTESADDCNTIPGIAVVGDDRDNPRDGQVYYVSGVRLLDGTTKWNTPVQVTSNGTKNIYASFRRQKHPTQYSSLSNKGTVDLVWMDVTKGITTADGKMKCNIDSPCYILYRNLGGW